MGATISEALETLKNADREEFQQEIEIIEEEISNLKTQIDSRRRVIRQVKMLAGIKIVRRESGLNGSARPSNNGNDVPKVWEMIRTYLDHAGPMSCSVIAKEIGKNSAAVGTELRKRKNSVFEQLADSRWRVRQLEDADND